MKVLQVIDRLNVGGAEKVMLNITRLLADKGIEVGVLLFNPGFPLDKNIDSRAKLFELNRFNKYSVTKLYEAGSVCKHYDIVHVHMRQCYAYIRLAQMLFGGKYKIVFHDHYHIETDSQVPWRLKGLFTPDYYVGVNDKLVAWAREYLQTKKKNVFLLPNTIIHSGITYHAPDTRNLMMLMVANIRQIKNIEFGIELAKKMECFFTIYGNKTDDDYYSHITSGIAEYNKIKIIEGVTEVASEYGLYNIAVHCSFSETGPLVLLEYLSAGLPFISYKTGDVAYTIYDELPLLFMESFVVEEWIERINIIIAQKDLPQKMRSVFNEYYNSDIYVNRCLAIYQSVNS